MQWIGKGAKGGESLVSISSDGRIVEWSMKKGLEYTVNLRLFLGSDEFEEIK